MKKITNGKPVIDRFIVKMSILVHDCTKIENIIPNKALEEPIWDDMKQILTVDIVRSDKQSYYLIKAIRALKAARIVGYNPEQRDVVEPGGYHRELFR